MVVAMVIFVLLGVLCLFYYGAIINYAGIHSSFSWFWLLAGVGLFLMAIAIYYIKNHDIQLSRQVRFLGGGIILLGMTVFLLVEGTIVMYANQEPETKVDYLIVLGAQVRGSHITKSLKERLDTAVEYLKDNENTKVIVSGGQGPGEDLTEAEAMMKYLMENGIDQSRVIKEERSTNTKENIEFSKMLITDEGASVAIVTNGFHMFRAVSIAKKQGIKNVQGLSAKSDPILFLNYYVREGLAVLKDKLSGNF